MPLQDYYTDKETIDELFPVIMKMITCGEARYNPLVSDVKQLGGKVDMDDIIARIRNYKGWSETTDCDHCVVRMINKLRST